MYRLAETKIAKEGFYGKKKKNFGKLMLITHSSQIS